MDPKEAYQALSFILKADKCLPKEAMSLMSKKNYMRKDLWARSPYKGKLLLVAAAAGNLERTKFLVEQCDAPLYFLDRATAIGPLTCAYQGRNESVLRYLVERKLSGIRPSIWMEQVTTNQAW
jgi:hypothetical protein